MPVEVYLDTNNIETVEAGVSVSFDPTKLLFAPRDVVIEDVYRAKQVEEIGPGRIDMSFFITP